jgi:hypothetical protein
MLKVTKGQHDKPKDTGNPEDRIIDENVRDARSRLQDTAAGKDPFYIEPIHKSVEEIDDETTAAADLLESAEEETPVKKSYFIEDMPKESLTYCEGPPSTLGKQSQFRADPDAPP